MTLNKLILFIFILFLVRTSSAQENPGARQIALSGSGVALSNDVFSLFNNPAGSAQMNWAELGFYYSPSPFGVEELSHGFAAFHQPFKFASISAGFMNYGFELYKENKLTLSFSRQFLKKFFLGISASYNFLKIQNYGNSSALIFSIGGLTYLNRNFRFGFAFENITRASYGSGQNQIPVILRSGVSYDFFSKASINFAVSKDIDFPFAFHFGMEYELIKYLTLRFGTATNPDTYSAGLGIRYSLLQLDYSVFDHPILGLTHQAGLIANFSETYNRMEKIKTFIFGR